MPRTAIVTGAASGIGLALSHAVAARGAQVVLADIDGDAAAAGAAQVAASTGTQARSAQVDVADAAAVADLIGSVHRELGRLDLLFNNAGIGAGAPPEDLTLEHWERTIDVNLRGVLHGCHAAFPLMLEQGYGRIVNTASVAGLLGGLSVAAPYATTKHGIVGLSLALRVAGANRGVGVHVLCPGAIETPLLDRTEFPGLPLPASARPMREFSTEAGVTRFWQPERLADFTLRQVARNRAIIVGPVSARVAWRLWRAAPETMLRLTVAADRWVQRRG